MLRWVSVPQTNVIEKYTLRNHIINRLFRHLKTFLKHIPSYNKNTRDISRVPHRSISRGLLCTDKPATCNQQIPNSGVLFGITTGWFPLSRNFYVLKRVKFTFANKIEAMYERSHVRAKVESRSTSRLISTIYILPLFYLRDYNLRALTCVAKHASVEINLTDRSHMEFLLRLFKFDGFSHQALYKKILLGFIPLIPVTRPREHFISVEDNQKSCRRSVSLACASTAV